VITVVVVEDDEIVAKVHRRVIERVPGYVVLDTVGTGTAAIERVMADRPGLVVLDLYLPDISGIEVLRSIRGAGLGTDVIVISAAREAETVRQVLRAGAVDYLVKPFRVDRLVQSLEDYRQHRAELAEARDFAQEEIDRLLGRPSRPDEAATPRAPKGIDPTTLAHITKVLSAANRGLTGDEVAVLTGVSRTTAHRYLRHLATTGEVRAEPTYGSVGRPELLYQWEQA